MLVLKRVAAVAAVIGALTTGAIGALVAPLLAGRDTALAAFGQATPWQFGLQDSASPVMDQITWFHNYLLVWITAISVFVLVLLVICLVRFNARANPTPSRVTHHTWLEVAWTVVPIFILLSIGVPSFKLLFLELDTPPVDVTVKATGKQWFWSYSYPDNGKFEFDSLMVLKDQLRLLSPQHNEMGCR